MEQDQWEAAREQEEAEAVAVDAGAWAVTDLAQDQEEIAYVQVAEQKCLTK